MEKKRNLIKLIGFISLVMARRTKTIRDHVLKQI